MNNPFVIDVENEQLETRNKKAGGTYQVQQAFAHTTNRDGSPKRYPTEIFVFPPRDSQGNPIPYKKGKYTIAPQSFKANGFGLEIDFLNLVPLKQA